MWPQVGLCLVLQLEKVNDSGRWVRSFFSPGPWSCQLLLTGSPQLVREEAHFLFIMAIRGWHGQEKDDNVFLYLYKQGVPSTP